MSKQAWSSLLLFLLFSVPSALYAQVIISEIMYDLAGTDSNEWIEVQNTSAQSIDLSTWKFFEGNSNHGLTAYQGDPNIPANGFAIIAHDPTAFKSEFAAFTGVIFDSSFSLSNTTGETLIIRDGTLSDIDSVSYTPDKGGNGDGNSLQKIGSDWDASLPTPGASNSSNTAVSQENSQANSQTTQTNSNSVSTYTSSATEFTSSTKQNTFSVSIGKDRLAAVSNPVEFKAEVKNADGYSGRTASFMWTLGDGSMKSGQAVTYNYRYPGDYIVVLNASRAGEDVVARVHVKVVDPNIAASAQSDGSVKVENFAKDDINLSEWRIESFGKYFVFPEDTIVKGQSSITIPSEVAGLTINPLIPLQIRNPMGLLYTPKQFAVHTEQSVESTTINQKKVVITPAFTEDNEVPAEISVSAGTDTPDKMTNSEASISQIVESNQNVAAVSSVVTIDKPKGFWRTIKDFFTKFLKK